MRTIIKLNIAVLLLFVCGCKKVESNPENYYPAVEIVSANKLPDGTVEVTGKVTRKGTSDLVYMGMCMDTAANPRMLSNQMRAKELKSDNTFSVIYSGLNATSNYYFKAWAANDHGYGLSKNEVSITDVTIDSNLVPCKPPLDSLTIISSFNTKKEKLYKNIKIKSTGGSDWEIDASTLQTKVLLTFSQKPISGIYKTVEGSIIKGFYVSILVKSYYVNRNADVYIREIENGNAIEVTLCEGKVYNVGSEGTMTTRFIARY